MLRGLCKQFESETGLVLLCILESITQKMFDSTERTKSVLDCSFSSMSTCRWGADVRDEEAVWRVLFMDKWTGESACAYRSFGYGKRKAKARFLDEAAVAKLWSTYVEPENVQCLRFRYRFEGGGRLSVLKHNRG